MRSRLTVTAFAALLCASLLPQAAHGRVDAPGSHGVGIAEYHLGEQAFEAPLYEGKNELDGAVYYPRNLERGKHPLILLQHGHWTTCADRAAEHRQDEAKKAKEAARRDGNKSEMKKQQHIIEKANEQLWRWPCKKGVPQLPSYRGYGYLAKHLAEQGFVVVSMGTNGINATDFGQADTVYRARARLLDNQLRMWKRLATSGDGQLAGRLRDPRTGLPPLVEFRDHIDMRAVGALGHSMGGGGVMQDVADDWHRKPGTPPVKAAFTLAPTDNFGGGPVTKTPFGVMWGTCDNVNTGNYFEQNSSKNRAPIHKLTATGANHDFYNTQWSPSSGQVAAHDDATPGKTPGTCVSQDGKQRQDNALDEPTQRSITKTYASAFFNRYLRGRTAFDPVLSGQTRPPHTPDVVRAQRGAPRT